MIDANVLKDFYTLTVGVAGFLLPVFQAVLLFVTEKSFNRLEFARQELVELYKRQGAVVSVCLVYLIVQPILLLLGLWSVAKISAVIFTLLIGLTRLRLLHDTGVWATTFSTKFIPAGKSAPYRYFRACINNEPPAIINASFLAVVLVLPIFFSQSMVVSVLLVLTYTIITIAALLNDPTSIQGQLLKSENTGIELNDDRNQWSDKKVESEKKVLAKYISSNDFYTEDLAEDKSRLFQYRTYWRIQQETGEFFCNVNLESLSLHNITDFKNRICEIVEVQFKYLSKAKTDVNSFVLSFHFTIDGQLRNAFFRSNKNEIESLKIKKSTDFVKGLKHKVFDEVLL